MMNAILEFISMICPITGNSIIDSIIFSIIIAFAFIVAWKLTDFIADLTDLHNSGLMSGVHWLIRIIVFVSLLAIVLGIVHLIQWVASWEWWGYLILGLSIAVIVSNIIFIRLLFKKKRKNKRPLEDEED